MTGALRVRDVWYLHGFASSPMSTKAGYFAERLRAYDVAWHCPDFNAPDFETLTMSRMLEQLERDMATRASSDVTVIGSSLGGALAVLAAARLPRIDRLALLAPALMFAKAGHPLLTPERVERWRRERTMDFFHYGAGDMRQLKYDFFEDAQRYSPFDVVFAQPTLIFQGMRDQSVDYTTVERFAATRPHVTLSLLDDDHALTASLPRLWTDLRSFLELDQE